MLGKVFFVCALVMAVSPTANAAVKWTTDSKVNVVQALNDGGFLITLDRVVNPVCQGAGDSKRVHIYPGQNGVTAEGAKALLSVAITAMVSNLNVSIMYDDAASNCWGKYIVLSR